LTTVEVNLPDVVGEVVRTQTALGREVVVRVPSHVLVHADAEALERVLINLVDNAFVHGSGVVEVEGAHEGGGFVRVSVLDRGRGIAPAEAARVFERFSRGPGVTVP